MVDREVLGDTAAHRQSHHVGAAAGNGIDQTGRVADQIGAGVAGRARRIADRAAGVAVVVPDDEPATRGQPSTELGVPPVHRRRGTGDQHDRGRFRITEGLHAQVHPVGTHHPFGHSAQLYDRPAAANRPRNRVAPDARAVRQDRKRRERRIGEGDQPYA